MTLLTTHNPIRPVSALTASELMHMFIDQETDALLVGACLALLAQREPADHELQAFAEALLSVSIPFPAPPVRVLDTCGTGGDGAHSANVSTLAALVLSALGVPVAKHGNRAATSNCGSADVLEGLGYDLARTPEQLLEDLDRHRFAFLFAPAYHPLLGRLREIRRRLGIPTIFNMLGPLLNPARPAYQVLGVAREALVHPMASALARLGVERAFVVHGKNAEGRGLDEASTEGPTIVCEVRDGQVSASHVLVPRDLGIVSPPRGTLHVSGKAQAIAVASGLQQGVGHPEFRPAIADSVALQAGLGLLLHGQWPLDRLRETMREARAALDAGFPVPGAAPVAA